MGNFEKLVVLTVLFLSAIVLAISLNDDKKKGEPGSPVGSARAQLAEEGARGGVQAATRRQEDRGGDLLLNTEVQPKATAAEDRPQAKAVSPASSGGLPGLLRSADGLRNAGIDDYMVYTAEGGDTWAGLSERFYGTGRHVSLLRHANEDMLRPIDGETILVPVYDFAEEAGRRAPLSPELRMPAVAQGVQADPEDQRVQRTEPAALAVETSALSTVDPRTVGEYEVRPGDSLSSIAQRVYGAGSRWNVIFEANRVLLESPDWLQVGMKLTIPRGAALDALVTTVASETAEAQSTDKKGRVR